MNLSPTGFTPPVNIPALQSEFSQLAVDLSRTDAKLEDNQRNGRRPTSGWDTTFINYAERLDAARMQFAQVVPYDTSMIDRLGGTVRTLAKLGGQAIEMQSHQLSFARGWDTVLDSAIRNAQEAVNILGNASPYPGPSPYPVAPAKD